MRRALLSALLFNAFLTSAFSQNAYYDAKIISKWIVTGTDINGNATFKIAPDKLTNDSVIQSKIYDSIVTILAKYFTAINGANSGNSAKVTDEIQKNPFFSAFSVLGITHGAGGGAKFLNLKSVLASVGGLDVTTIADGLAKFLVDRTKEELSIAFFNQLKQDFDDKKYATLQTLFPRTHHQLDLIGDKIYQFSSYLTDLRNAFTADLQDLIITIPYVLQLPEFQQYFAKRPWIGGVIQAGFFVASELLKRNPDSTDSIRHVANIIDSLNDRADIFFPPRLNSIGTTINGAIKTLHLLSFSLRSTDFTRAWISSNDFFSLINDDITFRIYLGLLYQNAKMENIIFNNDYPLTKIFDTIATNLKDVQQVKEALSNLMLQMNLFDEDIKTLDTMNQNNSQRISYYYALFNTSADLFLNGMSFIKTVTNGIGLSLPFVSDIDDYSNGFHDINSIYLAVRQKRFAQAVSATADFFTVILKYDSGKEKQIARLIQKLSTYGTFMANVANAETSDEVDSIITQTVLPAGSSYIKKHSVCNVALQAYTGIYAGSQQQATDAKYVGAAGLFAPVGIAASWGFARKGKMPKNPGSFSLFASIIDIGPLVSFRFTNYNDTIANDVQVRLAQIVSPGIHAVWGIPKLPLSLGVGCNWTPLLTDIEKEQTTVQTKNGFRYQVFLAVDIPLLNFHNKPR